MRAPLPFAALAAFLALSPPAVSAQAQGGEWSSAQTIEIQLSNYKFEPNTITMRRGQPYRLHLVSTGDHSFSSPKFFAAAQIAPQDAAMVTGGKIEVDKGAPRDVLLIPQQVGTYEFHCTHFMHAPMGMSGHITVQ
ncbi:cupredoxin domain-containing protein [Caulobacter sp. 17J65-9]|uniref:cupredoxin domain-containing protein n=1 Tax=Caulobacter sp. 17J65-9 TaxID=2709382 RepID=UPI0013CBBF19|nr:cupredoxin domain-containing protein [Caulobacter sp. 17J65-9]NEX94417.1 copper-binding protein [Caulobacter sp. 17J65-9]